MLTESIKVYSAVVPFFRHFLHFSIFSYPSGPFFISLIPFLIRMFACCNWTKESETCGVRRMNGIYHKVLENMCVYTLVSMVN